MGGALKTLLPDFAEDDTPDALAAAAGVFEPLFDPRGAAPGFDPSPPVPVRAPCREDVAPVRGHMSPDRDAAGLQSMLTQVFTPPAAQAPQAVQALQRPPSDGVEGDPASAQPGPAMPEPEADRAAEGPDSDARIAGLTAEIEALRKAHAAELARLAGHAVPAMAEAVAGAVKAVLGPMLAHPLMAAVETAALDRFCAQLAEAIRAGGWVRAKVSGPQALLDTLAADWPPDLAAPEFALADEAELVAIVDTQVLSTRLGEMRALLMGDAQ